MIALRRARIPVERYTAYEIDKFAIQTSKHNFPEIEHCGDVFDADFKQYLGTTDILMGGSPCTYWSIAQSPDKRETTASGMGWELFSQYVRAIREAEPRYFIYENNKSMPKDIYAAISDAFGFEPVLINSALVSAQNRQRYYWVGKRNEDGSYSKVDVQQPEDRGILLKDIIDGAVERNKGYAVTHIQGNARDYLKKHHTNVVFEPIGMTINGKARTLRAAYYKDGDRNFILPVDPKTAVAQQVGEFEPVCMRQERTATGKALRKDYETGAIKHGYSEHKVLQPRVDGKTNTLSTVLKDNPICQQVGALPRPNGELSKSQGFRIYDTDQKSVTLKGGAGGAGGKTGLYAFPVELSGGEMDYMLRDHIDFDENGAPTKVISIGGSKEYTVYKVEDGQIEFKGRKYPIKLVDGYYIIRKLTVSECMRLQTVPEWFEFPVSNTQAYKQLGNGWTVDVIVHLLEAIARKENYENKKAV